MTTEDRIKALDHTKKDRRSGETLPLPLVVLLHLLPGTLLIGAVLVLAPPFIERGVPYQIAYTASALLTSAPFMVGAMLLYGRRKHGRLTLRGVVRFRRPMPLWQYAALGVPMLAVAFAILSTTAPVSSFLAERVFFWLPPYLLPSWTAVEMEATAPNLVLFALVAKLIFDGFVYPVFEEVYFRGFLLPRMGYLDVLAPAVSSLLFAVQHFWQPYNWPVIFLIILLPTYVVWWKRNIYIGLLWHCSVNIIGATLALLTFFSG